MSHHELDDAHFRLLHGDCGGLGAEMACVARRAGRWIERRLFVDRADLLFWQSRRAVQLTMSDAWCVERSGEQTALSLRETRKLHSLWRSVEDTTTKSQRRSANVQCAGDSLPWSTECNEIEDADASLRLRDREICVIG